MNAMLTITLMLIAAATAASVQSRSDFSGDWRAEAQTAAPQTPGSGPPPAGDMGSGWGASLTLRQDDKQLVVEDRLFTRYDLQPPVRLVYALDGSESVNTVMLGHSAQTRRSRAAWKEQTLEITTQFRDTHPATGQPFMTEVVQRLRLASPDTLVVEVTRTTSGATPSSTRATYRKQAPQG